jgi:hypothetical protein
VLAGFVFAAALWFARQPIHTNQTQDQQQRQQQGFENPHGLSAPDE